MNTVVKIQPKDVTSISYQEASIDIWDKKYRLTAKDGSPIDKSMDDTYKRVARALADVEREGVRNSGGTRHLERGRLGAQARDFDDQLHGVGDDPRLHGRYSQQGA
jgi:ribonucleoside-diphosphate reductase alpha chain